MKKIIIFLSGSFIGLFCSYLFFIYNFMEISEKEAAKLRDELHNLDYATNDVILYYDKLYYIIAGGEGFSSRVYKDTKGKLTIGYGFNMDRGDASKNEWNDIFEGSVNFDDAKKGDIGITKKQARKLKRYGVGQREEELSKIYAPYWNRMRLNERAISTDLYYQSPKLAGAGTRFCRYMKEYYETGDPRYLGSAVEEVKLRSSYSENAVERLGLQSRNDIRAIILDSRGSPLYSNPRDELIPEDKIIEISLGETVIPREVSAKFPESRKLGDYYIWRTSMDDKVRSDHGELEGKVFKHEDDIKHPGEDYGCRCWKQKLPVNAKIIKKEKVKGYSLSSAIVRKYIANLDRVPKFCIG